MPSPAAPKKRIAIIGGGISGLAAAQRLTEPDANADFMLYEAGDSVGGILQTERRDGFLIERSADMFTTREPWALDLCRRLEISHELISTNAEHRRAFIVHRGKLVPTPPGFMLMSPARIWPVMTTPLLSWRGKLRLAGECLVRARRDDRDESLAQFATRRMGREAFERIIQPLVSGIYTADPDKLSMAAGMPQFVEMERKYGGLIRAARKGALAGNGKAAAGGKSDSAARYGAFTAPRDGMGRLPQAIADYLPAGCVRLRAPISRLLRGDDGKWRVTVSGIQQQDRFDAVIVALPAPAASVLLAEIDAALAADLARIDYASAAVVVLAHPRKQIEHPLDGFGFVVPQVERRRLLAVSFSSVKFAGRAPQGQVLLRAFVGGACQGELVDLDDDAILAIVREELGDLIGLRGDSTFAEVVRWRRAMPQYHVGHLSLVERIEQRFRAIPGLELAGNAFRGVGVPFCIHSGVVAAENLLGGAETPRPAAKK